MELEKLTKAQIVLLTLLVSFVTSIATGIVTVTLMDQAPPGVSHTINRVVERTVERVVPQKKNENAAAVAQTVVVESDEKIANAVGQNEQSLVRIYAVTQVNAGTTTQQTAEGTDAQPKTKETFVALGLIASQEGLIVTDSGAISGSGTYKVRLPNGEKVDAQVARQDEVKGIGLMELAKAENLTPVAFGHASSLSLGQTVLALIGEHSTALSQGLATKFEAGTLPKEGEGGEEKQYREIIHTSLNLDASATGSALFTIEGDVAGMVLVRDGSTQAVTAEAITAMIKRMHETEESSGGEDAAEGNS